MQVEARRIEAIERALNRVGCEIGNAQGHWTKQFEDVQKRIDEQDVRINELERDNQRLQEMVAGNFGTLDGKIDGVEVRHDAQIATLTGRMDEAAKRIVKLEKGDK